MTGEFEELLTPAEVAKAFRVDPKTVARWARQGLLDSTRTPGGHRRFRRDDVDALLRGGVRPSAATGRMSREQAAQLLARYVRVDWRSLLADRDAAAAAYRVAAVAAKPDPDRYLAVTAARDRLLEGP